jgi:hypothetical protein
MPKSPDGARRPADAIGSAVHVMKLGAGEIEKARPVSEPSAFKPKNTDFKSRVDHLKKRYPKILARLAE